MDLGEEFRTSGLAQSDGLQGSPVFKAVVPAGRPPHIPGGSD